MSATLFVIFVAYLISQFGFAVTLIFFHTTLRFKILFKILASPTSLSDFILNIFLETWFKSRKYYLGVDIFVDVITIIIPRHFGVGLQN